jgi:hypothetical protein
MSSQFQKLGELATAYIHESAHIDNIPRAVQQWSQEHREDLEEIISSDYFKSGL